MAEGHRRGRGAAQGMNRAKVEISKRYIINWLFCSVEATLYSFEGKAYG